MSSSIYPASLKQLFLQMTRKSKLYMILTDSFCRNLMINGMDEMGDVKDPEILRYLDLFVQRALPMMARGVLFCMIGTLTVVPLILVVSEYKTT